MLALLVSLSANHRYEPGGDLRKIAVTQWWHDVVPASVCHHHASTGSILRACWVYIKAYLEYGVSQWDFNKMVVKIVWSNKGIVTLFSSSVSLKALLALFLGIQETPAAMTNDARISEMGYLRQLDWLFMVGLTFKTSAQHPTGVLPMYGWWWAVWQPCKHHTLNLCWLNVGDACPILREHRLTVLYSLVKRGINIRATNQHRCLIDGSIQLNVVIPGFADESQWLKKLGVRTQCGN